MEEIKYTHCPNCGIEIKKEGILKIGNSLFYPKDPKFFRKYANATSDVFCEKCQSGISRHARENYHKIFESKKEELKVAIDDIPIVSIQNPSGWDYSVIDIVTSQYVTGTGFLTEIKADFSDFLGRESQKMNSRLSEGEQKCFQRMRNIAASKGANAIIGVDIDYAEVGGIKGMLMVCTAGTAVNLKNPEILNTDKPYLKNVTNLFKEVSDLVDEYPYDRYV
ncbi:heavy metal-binding domain-containing protein [Arcicella aquatica]|uniref:Heavy metal-binding domain-containing protein n=1 Tax=Arcicella aquatica TaxID=217141 RepID=A0ABU5QS26_9BACT|nr:heavy metal-binding domain-containing protein [Arcicella aquatica]MEA5259903.1 heavy metal-binding domain-containing protein [Arcicella aquatica]